METVKVAIWGFGAMGSGIASVLLRKSGVDICGVCDNHEDRAGHNIYDLLEIDPAGRPPVVIKEDIGEVVTKRGVDVCILATDSFVKKAFDKIKYLLENGVNVITTAEEMSYPQAKYPAESAELNRIGAENGATVLGTGINPGLVMDLLAICLSGAMTDVENVLCRRVNSLSPFGPAVMEEQGVGLTREEFERGVSKGTLTGHVGFEESVGMISNALGLGVDRFQQQMMPIITKVRRKSRYAEAGEGDVAGVDMQGQGFSGDKRIITMEHPQQIEPETEGVHTGDYIVLEGSPRISMEIKPEIDGGLGTIAMCVNCIPLVINARPGLVTMIDLPVPRAIMDDFRNHIDPGKKVVE
jgi:4-hydroxy-tetrahydrodipicolinate reductase